MGAARPSRWRTWLQLFRAPNLFTVPGDPLAGHLLATRGSFAGGLWPAMAASLCFYGAGLLMNDLADRAEDARDRPERPLPSGAARVRTVWIVTAALLVMGLLWCAVENVAALGVGLLIVIAVASYNFGLKKIPVLGASLMGICRGGSLLLGAACADQISLVPIVAACLTAVFIAAVTNLARFEMEGRTPLPAKLLPLLALALGVVAFPVRAPRVNAILFFAFYALALGVCSHLTKRLLREKNAPLPPFIGAFIRVLLLVQAAFCAGSDIGWRGGGAALLLLALVPISRLVGRRFYAS